MTVDAAAIPGLVFLGLELLALAGVGFVVARGGAATGRRPNGAGTGV